MIENASYPSSLCLESKFIVSMLGNVRDPIVKGIFYFQIRQDFIHVARMAAIEMPVRLGDVCEIWNRQNGTREHQRTPGHLSEKRYK